MDLSVITPWQHEDKNAQHRVYNALRKDGVLINLHYMPIYHQPYYEVMGFKTGYCVEAERYYNEAISLPMYATLSEVEQDKVVALLHKALN